MPDEVVLSGVKSLMPQLQALGVTSVRLFGSAVRGTMGDESDVDILVEFAGGDASNYFKILFLLEDELSRKVDLVLPETLHRRIRTRVLAEALRVA